MNIVKDAFLTGSTKTDFEKSVGLFGDNISSCKKNINLLNMGILCYLTSGSATEKTTVANTVLTVELDEASTEANNNICVDVFKMICENT